MYRLFPKSVDLKKASPLRGGGPLAVEGCIRYAYMIWRCESKPFFLFNIFVCEITPPSPPLKGEASVFATFVGRHGREAEDAPSVPEKMANRSLLLKEKATHTRSSASSRYSSVSLHFVCKDAPFVSKKRELKFLDPFMGAVKNAKSASAAVLGYTRKRKNHPYHFAAGGFCIQIT